jgi:ubiquinone/menaquinone biosynthesis C-methylase UbiE
MSATLFRKNVIKKYVKEQTNIKILDIGCGPADVLENFQKINYYGFDTNQEYINHAKKKYKNKKPKLYCREFVFKDAQTLPKMDYVLLFGIIHHLKDNEINKLLKLCKKILKRKGKLIVVEPVLLKKQNIIAKTLIKLDRGSNVKSKQNYIKTFKKSFKNVFTKIIVQNFIPYTWFLVICKKNN